VVSLLLLGFLCAGQLAGNAQAAGDRRSSFDRFSGPSKDPSALFAYSQHFRTPGGNFAPRLGIAWSIDSKTVVRVNSGIFYEAAADQSLVQHALYRDGGSSSYTASIQGTARWRAAVSLPPCRTEPAAFYARYLYHHPNFKERLSINPASRSHGNSASHDALTVGYANTGGRNLEFLRNMKLINPIGSLADGRPVYSSPSTRYAPRSAV